MSPRQPPPVPPRKPGGPNRRLQVYIEPEVYNEVERRSKEHEWSISREGGALIARALNVVAESETGPGAEPTPKPADRVEALMAEMNVSRPIAERLAAREAERG